MEAVEPLPTKRNSHRGIQADRPERVPIFGHYDIDDDVVRVAAIRRQQQEPDYWASDHE
jgi:hypothetical protein